MLGWYGEIQAEMAQERERQTHIAFRSSYNLDYKLVWPNDNLPTFVMDRDAYAVNKAFMEKFMKAINIYLSLGKEQFYGVRDEYRMSGMAMEEILEDLSHSVLKSSCNFLLRLATGLDHNWLQLGCSCELPPFCDL